MIAITTTHPTMFYIVFHLDFRLTLPDRDCYLILWKRKILTQENLRNLPNFVLSVTAET